MGRWRKRDHVAELEKLLRAHRSEAPRGFIRALARDGGSPRYAFRPRLRYALVGALAAAMVAAGVSAGLPGLPTPVTHTLVTQTSVTHKSVTRKSVTHTSLSPTSSRIPADDKPKPPSNDQYESQCGTPPYEQCVVEVNPDKPKVNQPTLGTTTLTFTLTLKKPSHGSFSVACTPSDGTATAGDDYVAATSTASFGPGDKSATCSITINGEATAEPDQTFTVTFTPSSSAAVMDKDDTTQTVTLKTQAKPPKT